MVKSRKLADFTVRYFGDHNIEGMFATLAPLHDLLKQVSIKSLTDLFPSANPDRARSHSEKYLSRKLLVEILKKLLIGATRIVRQMKLET